MIEADCSLDVNVWLFDWLPTGDRQVTRRFKLRPSALLQRQSQKTNNTCPEGVFPWVLQLANDFEVAGAFGSALAAGGPVLIDGHFALTKMLDCLKDSLEKYFQRLTVTTPSIEFRGWSVERPDSVWVLRTARMVFDLTAPSVTGANATLLTAQVLPEDSLRNLAPDPNATLSWLAPLANSARALAHLRAATIRIEVSTWRGALRLLRRA